MRIRSKTPVLGVPRVLMKLHPRSQIAFIRSFLITTIAYACSPALSSPITSYGSILVKAVDEYGKPARNAHVEVLGARLMDTADSTGVISLHRVSPETYTLLVAQDGGGREVRSGVHVTSGMTTTV